MATVQNLIGYTLGNEFRNPLTIGQKWLPYDGGVGTYVCLTQDAAKEILNKNQAQPVLEPYVHLTTIYRVAARNIDVYDKDCDMVWTRQPTKLVVLEKVYTQIPHGLSETDILVRGRNIAEFMAKRINQLNK